MPLNKEIWVPSIVGHLHQPNTVLAKSVDHSEYIDGKTVHVPNAGAAAKIGKNITELPLTVSSRTDLDLTYNIDDFKIYPMVVTDLEQVELSYNKRESVTAENRAKLYDEVTEDTVAKWVAGAIPVKKTGSIRSAIKAAAKKFAKDRVPKGERYIMLTEEGYYDFLDELSEKEQFAFSATADAAKGILGTFFGFQFVDEYYLPKDVHMLAWQKQSLSHAIGNVKLYSSEGDPTYYGDVVSGELRAGGSVIRNDKKGVYVVDADGVADTAPKDKMEDMDANE